MSRWYKPQEYFKKFFRMNCEKCRWYKRAYPVYTFGEFSARCLLGGCDGSQYNPSDENGNGIATYFTCSNCGAKMGEDGDE